MKIILHSNALTKRGDSITLSSYAKALKNKYQIDCDLVYNIKDNNNSIEVIENLKTQGFSIFGYENLIQLDKYAAKENIKTIYWLKSGQNDGKYLSDCKNCVHVVFNVVSPHGNVYAYVSEWLANEAQFNYRSRALNMFHLSKKVLKKNFSKNSIDDLIKCTFSNLLKPFQYVPHIIDLPQPNIDFKKKYNIPKYSFLIGRIGGYTEFNINFVKETIKKILIDDKNNFFVFVNTEPFIDNDRVLFINDYINEAEKASFINSCNLMLHARNMGETFGFAIAESLSMNIPIASCKMGHDRNHHILLKDTNLLYSNSDELFEIYIKVKEKKYNNYNFKHIVDQFSPEKVAEKFNNVFLT